jgi:uncharacterized protein YdeI (BOF family)
MPFILACALAVGVIAAGCGSSSGTSNTTAVKTQAEPDAMNVKVEAIATSPMEFDNQTVTTEGNYAVGYCSACFLLKDGVSAVRVEVSDTAPLPPESKLNSRMRVTGKIYVANGSPNIVATKIEYL